MVPGQVDVVILQQHALVDRVRLYLWYYVPEEWLSLAFWQAAPLVQPLREVDIFYLVECHAGMNRERIVSVVLDGEAVIEEQEHVAALAVEVVDLLALFDRTSYVVIERNICVRLHLLLNLSGRLEPREVFVLVLF